MTILTIALKYLRGRLLASADGSVGCPVSPSVIASILMSQGIKEFHCERDRLQPCGAKGSPMQPCSGSSGIDVATPNIQAIC
jgi:hypothetical protein